MEWFLNAEDERKREDDLKAGRLAPQTSHPQAKTLPVSPEETEELDFDSVVGPGGYQEVLDTYCLAIETGIITDDAFVAAAILLEEARMENKALKAMVKSRKLTLIATRADILLREGESQAHPNRVKLRAILGKKTFSRNDYTHPGQE